MFERIDMIGAIAGTAVYAVLIGVLVGYAGMGGARKLALLAFAAAWLGLIVTVAALGGFATGVVGRFPAPVIAFLTFGALLFGSWFLLPGFREGLLSLPFSALVGVNAARLGGIMFLLLGAQGRLSAPFAPIAGAGDMVIGALAIPLAVMAARGHDASRGWLGAWNVLGALDLVVAITLASLSAPGTPFRVFAEGPGTLAFTGLPWILVPAVLVPLYFLIHFTIAVKLGAMRRGARAVPTPA